jgi:hypothetical protein
VQQAFEHFLTICVRVHTTSQHTTSFQQIQYQQRYFINARGVKAVTSHCRAERSGAIRSRHHDRCSSAQSSGSPATAKVSEMPPGVPVNAHWVISGKGYCQAIICGLSSSL